MSGPHMYILTVIVFVLAQIAIYAVFTHIFRTKTGPNNNHNHNNHHNNDSSGPRTEQLMSGHLKSFTQTCWLSIVSNIVYGSFAFGLAVRYSPWVYLDNGKLANSNFGERVYRFSEVIWSIRFLFYDICYYYLGFIFVRRYKLFVGFWQHLYFINSVF